MKNASTHFASLLVTSTFHGCTLQNLAFIYSNDLFCWVLYPSLLLIRSVFFQHERFSSTIHVPCFKLFHYVICRQLWYKSPSYVCGGITFSKTVGLQYAVLLKTARRCSLKILISKHSGSSTGFCKHLSVNHCKQTLGGFSQIHVYYNKLLYYAISLHLWSEFLDATCGALIFIRFIRLAACYLGKNRPF